MITQELPSLSGLFEAPENFRGEAGVVCGYSADSGFMDVALERFSGRTAAQRGAEGRIRLLLVLDPGNPQIAPDAVPAMLHLPVVDSRPKIGLLHSKVALLLFRATDPKARSTWILRLIVCTGNWTRQTANQSIDLFWHIELSSDMVEESSPTAVENAVDLSAAWDFLSWILKRCCGEDVKGPSGHLLLLRELDEAIGKAAKLRSRNATSRFMDNRKRSIVDCITTLAKDRASGQKPNYLALGSAYFNGAESGTDDGTEAFETIEAIRQRLVENDLLTARPELDLVINPLACQGVASAAARLRGRGWTIRPPAYLGQTTNRFLHAKFAFWAVDQSGNACRPWLYIGSGNLTRQGFLSSIESGGNLEAGVLLRTSRLRWEADKRRKCNFDAVNFMLPIQWDQELTPESQFEAGEGMESREPVFLAPPVAVLHWSESADGNWLSPPPDSVVQVAYAVLGPDDQDCELIGRRFRWNGPQPRQATIHWDPGHRGLVPVVGQDGRIAGSPLLPRQIGEIWGDLVGFPEPSDAEEENEDDDLGNNQVGPGTVRHQGAKSLPSSTVIRTTMELVERIAARQTRLSEGDWRAWCDRLEQTMLRAAKTSDVAELQRLEVNLLSPLRNPAFRPPFAQPGETAGISYDATLSRIEVSWNIAGMRAVGAKS